MFSKQFIAGLFALLPALASAAPSLAPRTPTAEFSLKIHIPKPEHPKCHSKFEGKYIGSYHTGAGEGDVTGYDASVAKEKAYLNDTHLLFDIYEGYPAAMRMYGGQQPQYISWLTPVINIGDYPYNETYYGSFFINSTGLQWSSSANVDSYQPGDLFGGWLVCEWWHGAGYPQLFWLESTGAGTPVPSKNCEKAELVVEYS